jgi:hypothetical protein
MLARYPIERKGTRNNVLMELNGDLIHKFGREASERIVREHYRRYEHNIQSPIDEHMRVFAEAWEGMRTKLIESLLPDERRIFNSFASDHQQEGFLIVRAFAGAARHEGKEDFAISQSSLADRLSVTPPGAACVIRRFFDVNAIELTQPAIRHVEPARFRWVPPTTAPRQ